MRISDWSSDVCSSDLFVEAAGEHPVIGGRIRPVARPDQAGVAAILAARKARDAIANLLAFKQEPEFVCDGVHVLTLLVSFESARSEEHTSELQSLMRISYAVFCLKKKIK